MKHLMILIAGAFLLLQIGCSGDSGNNGTDPPQVAPMNAYFPLQVGNSWTYEYTLNENVLDSLTSEITEVDTVFGDSIAYHASAPALFDGPSWLVFTGGELRSYYQNPDQSQDYQVFLKTPLEVGTRWVHDVDYSNDTLWSEIVSTDASISVPKGNFDHCLQVGQTTDMSGYDTVNCWYAPNVGLVLQRMGWDTLGVSIFMDYRLKDYHLE